MTAFNRPSPVLLSSSCDVAQRNSSSPKMTELSYPFRKAVLIDEIRFDLRATKGGATTTWNLGAVIYAAFTLGQHYLMRDSVPIWLLGTTMDWAQEQMVDTHVGTVQLVSHYRWRLPEPLYIEAGQVLRPVFNRVITGGGATEPTGDINVQVSYAGRVVPPNAARPKSIAIPYAASFVTTVGSTYQQSNEYHLLNPFDFSLRVQRMTGRLANVSIGAAVLPGLTASPPTGAIGLQIDDSWGGKIVNDLTGPGDIFDGLRAAWTFDTVMPAKGQYNVRAWNIPTSQQLHVGMIGTREEAL